jgi:hypothetical protein
MFGTRERREPSAIWPERRNTACCSINPRTRLLFDVEFVLCRTPRFNVVTRLKPTSSDPRSPLVLSGLGRSGTTAVAGCLAAQADVLWVEEPNFVTDLVIPAVSGELPVRDALSRTREEGWRGPMKACPVPGPLPLAPSI